MINEREFASEKKRASPPNIRSLANALWHIKWWLLLSAAVCAAGAFLYIRHTTPVYKKSISIVLNNRQNSFADSYHLVTNTLGDGASSPIDDRLFLLRSAKLMQRVVERLDLGVRYFSVGRFIEVEQYTASPMIFSFIPAEGFENVRLEAGLTLTGQGAIRLEEMTINGEPFVPAQPLFAPGEKIVTPAGSFTVAPRGGGDPGGQSGRWRITRSGAEHTATVLASRLVIQPAPQQTNVMTLSLEDRHPARAEDVLNTLMEEYNILAKTYDSQSILNTISFLDERIAGLEGELREAAESYSDYRPAREVQSAGTQPRPAVAGDPGYRERLDELSLQTDFLASVKQSLQGENVHRLIPANIGISDGGLNSMIAQYNQLVIDRDRMLAASSAANPRVQDATATLNSLKATVMQSVDNLQAAYALQRRSFEERLGSNRQTLAAMPVRQLALTRMSQSQQVKEPLYILLQQKREEALLMLSSLSDSAYVIDSAYGSNLPVFPKKGEIYLWVFILSIAAPAGIVLVINIFRRKIMFEKDIVDRLDIPVLGIVPRAAKDKRSPMRATGVTASGRDPISESFRMLRSKFQYLDMERKRPGAAVLQITSSGPREGKSFISVNMAISLALLKKKILLVEADLRQPSIGRYLRMSLPASGLSDYLAGRVEDVRRIITKYKGTAPLDVILTGAIPPNPGELLASGRLDEAFETLRDEYDYIIVDSAPFLLVSDSFSISRLADSVLWVARSGFTRLDALDRLQNIVREGGFSSIMVVLNSVDFKRNLLFGGGRRGMGYGYGYGYGYSYGHGARYGYVGNTK